MALDAARIEALKQHVRDVPDFPKPGIVFKDITNLLRHPTAFRDAIDLLSDLVRDQDPDVVVAIESRGFIVGSAVAIRLGKGFVPVRKPGKLPAKTIKVSYALEYGQDSLEIHADALERGARALIVDDVIATGGTARATADLVERLGGRVALYAFLVELDFLNGRDKLRGYEVRSLIHY
jgi:adenine phosphoribosyltransferase